MIPVVWIHRKKLKFVDYRINKEGVVKRVRDGGKYKAGKIITPYKSSKGYIYIHVSLKP